MRPLLPMLLLVACSGDTPSDDGKGGTGHTSTTADTDTDTDADADADADADTDTDADTDSFEGVRSIFHERCTPCHIDTIAPSSDLLLEEAADMVGVPSRQTNLDLVEPGDPEASYLWLKINGRQDEAGGGSTMPPLALIPQLERDAIEAWILAGALASAVTTDTGTDPSIHQDNPLCDPVQALCIGAACPPGPTGVSTPAWHNRLTASPEIVWEAVPGAVSYEVAIGSAPGLDDVGCWTPSSNGGTDTSFAFPAIWVLDDATTYIPSVRAFYADGTVSDASAGLGWTVDVQPPDAPSLVSDHRTSVDGHMGWDHPGTDVGAGFDHFEVAIGTAPLGNDEVDWMDVGTDLEAFLDPSVLAPGAWHWLSVRAHDAAGNKSVAVTSEGFITCPANYTFVPGDPLLSTTPFCVATYEMRPSGVSDGAIGFDNSLTAESRPDGTPWSIIGTADARVLCDNLGFSYQIVSNQQWQTVARSIERTPENWSGGAVGAGFVNRGHCDEDPLQPLSSAGDPCVGTNNPNCEDPSSPDWAQKRTHWLENGEVIWDLSGNLQERVDGSTGAPDGLWMDFDSAAFTTAPGWEAYRANLAPEGPYTYLQGMGRVYGGSGIATRGGSYDPSSAGSAGSKNDEDVGIFSTHHNTWNTTQTEGFRCVFVPM